MKLHSLDLCQKVIDAFLKNNASQRKLAEQFGAALILIYKPIQQYRKNAQAFTEVIQIV